MMEDYMKEKFILYFLPPPTNSASVCSKSRNLKNIVVGFTETSVQNKHITWYKTQNMTIACVFILINVENFNPIHLLQNASWAETKWPFIG